MTDLPDQRDGLLLLGLPHPATRALATYLRGILVACGEPVDCELTVDDREVPNGRAAIHLRPEVTNTLNLVASFHSPAEQAALAGYSLAVRLDERWRGLPRLSVERVLADSGHASGLLSSCLQIPITAEMLTAADKGLPDLRSAIAPFEHPAAFWFALDTEVPFPTRPVEPIAGPDDGCPAGEKAGHAEGIEHSAAAAESAAMRAAGNWPDRFFILTENRWSVRPAHKS